MTTNQNLPSLVVSIKIDHLTHQQMLRLRQLIGSHFIFAKIDVRTGVTIYAHPLRGFSLFDIVTAYKILLRDYHPVVSLICAYLPLSGNDKKGGRSC